jgi:lipocalin
VSNATKTYNIYIKNADWVVITDNNLFESGYESIYLDYVTHPVVSNNNIAWCGQRQPSSAILLNYSGGTTLQSFIKISDNNISKSTKHGIELVGVSYGSVDGNVIECQLSNYAYYYGSTSLASISHYGTYINSADSTASLKLVVNNTNMNVSNCNRTNYVDKPRKDITDTSTTIDTEGLDQINLVQPSATTVTDLLNGFNGKRITLFGFNSNTTIQYNSSKFVFRGGTDINIPNAGVLTLEYFSGKWYEISRSFPALSEPYVSLDITDTRTTIDAASILNFNLIQSAATTVTAISGGVNGKIVTLQGFNANTTIQYGTSTILLKGAVNVTIPNTGILTLRYYAGKWYEISRSF